MSTIDDLLHEAYTRWDNPEAARLLQREAVRELLKAEDGEE